MSRLEQLDRLLKELQRVGVDPNTVSAGLAVSDDDLLKELAALPDDAGPEAFLARLRLATLARDLGSK